MLKSYIEIPIKQLVAADWNYKKGENADDYKKKIEALKANMKRNGQIENIVVRHLPDDKFEVVNGNHRLIALTELGVKTVVAFDLGDISLKAAQRIAIETNETRFDADNIALGKLFKDIIEDCPMDDLLATMPYSEAEMNNLVGLADFDFGKYDTAQEDETEDATGRGGSKKENEAEADWDDVTLHLPVETAATWAETMARVKGVLYPKKDSKRVSHVFAIEALITMVAGMDDGEIREAARKE